MGCDGVHSRTRALLFPSAPQTVYQGYLGVSGLLPMSALSSEERRTMRLEEGVMNMTRGRAGVFPHRCRRSLHAKRSALPGGAQDTDAARGVRTDARHGQRRAVGIPTALLRRLACSAAPPSRADVRTIGASATALAELLLRRGAAQLARGPRSADWRLGTRFSARRTGRVARTRRRPLPRHAAGGRLLDQHT